MQEWIIDNPEEQIFRVNRRVFLDEKLYELEKERIFDKCWIYIGHESEIPNIGDFQTRIIVDRPFIFCRDTDGQVRALINTCPHRGAMVCRERHGNSRTFVCFYHSWSFNTKGELIGIPGEESYGKGFKREEMGLYPAPRLEHYRGFYFINFDPNAIPLHDYLAGAKEYLDYIIDQSPKGEMEVLKGTQEYNIKANWKLLVENSFDGYHLIPTHITFIEYIRDSDERIRNTKQEDIYGKRGGMAIDLGNGHAVTLGESSGRGRPVAHWMKMYGEESKEEIEQIYQDLVARLGKKRADIVAKSNRNLFIFPNLIINDGSSVTIRQFFPDGPGVMKVRACALGGKGESETTRARRLHGFLSFYGPASFATPDDVAALEMCQSGFAAVKEVGWNDLSRGMNKPENEPHWGTDEHQMRVFWRMWNRYITGGVK